MFLSGNAIGQNHNLISQYFQVMPFYAPGLTGANDFLDIRTGIRKQWTDIDGAPISYFIGGAGILKIGRHNPNKYNSVRVGNDSPYHRKTTKLGVGGYIFDETIGAARQTGAMISTAVHVTITNSAYLSLGVTTGYHNTRFNPTKLRVLNPNNDVLYQELLNNGASESYFKLNTGIAVYSESFYLSYALLNAADPHISGNPNLSGNSSEMLHTIVGGYRISTGQNLEVIQASYIRFSQTTHLLFDLGARFRYNQNFYMGMSYRNDQTLIALFGMTLDNTYSLGYSFERKQIDFSSFNTLSHEIVIGVKLFNSKNYTSLW